MFSARDVFFVCFPHLYNLFVNMTKNRHFCIWNEHVAIWSRCCWSSFLFSQFSFVSLRSKAARGPTLLTIESNGLAIRNSDRKPRPLSPKTRFASRNAIYTVSVTLASATNGMFQVRPVFFWWLAYFLSLIRIL